MSLATLPAQCKQILGSFYIDTPYLLLIFGADCRLNRCFALLFSVTDGPLFRPVCCLPKCFLPIIMPCCLKYLYTILVQCWVIHTVSPARHYSKNLLKLCVFASCFACTCSTANILLGSASMNTLFQRLIICPGIPPNVFVFVIYSLNSASAS